MNKAMKLLALAACAVMIGLMPCAPAELSAEENERMENAMNALKCILEARFSRVSLAFRRITGDWEAYRGKVLVWCREDGRVQVIQIQSDDRSADLYMLGEDERMAAGAGYALYCLEALGLEEDVLRGVMDGAPYEALDGMTGEEIVLYLTGEGSEAWYDLSSLRPASDEEITAWRGAFAVPAGGQISLEKSLVMPRLGEPDQNTDLLNYLIRANSSGTPLYMSRQSAEEKLLPQYGPGIYLIPDEDDTAYVVIESDSSELFIVYKAYPEEIAATLGWIVTEMALCGVDADALDIFQKPCDDGTTLLGRAGFEDDWSAGALMAAFLSMEDLWGE